MAEYSHKPLVRKLGLRDGQRVLVLGKPTEMDLSQHWAPLPDFATLRHRAPAAGNADFDVVIAFCPDRATLATRLPAAISQINRHGMIWAVWPKKSGPRYAHSKNGITDSDVRAAARAAGVVDVLVCAFDDAWSALKLVYRLRDR
jgi:hypothetical protein